VLLALRNSMDGLRPKRHIVITPPYSSRSRGVPTNPTIVGHKYARIKVRTGTID
jgi:hypothetical protein